MGHVIVVGSANMDLVFRAPRVPVPGETLLGSGFALHPGGKGANQAVAAARMGAEVTFVGALGDDPNGHALREVLTSEGIDLRHCPTVADVPTGCAGIFVGEDGQNSIVVAAGTNALVTARQVRAAIAEDPAAVVLCSLEVPWEAATAVEGARYAILNPAPAPTGIPSERLTEGLERFDVITPNESECEALSGVRPDNPERIEEAVERLARWGVTGLLLTLGSFGAVWRGGEEKFLAVAPQVQPVDTTAAGDCLNGVFAALMAEGATPIEALGVAVRAATLSVTRAGALPSLPYRHELGQVR